MNKTFMVCFALLALFTVGQGFYGENLRQRLMLTEQQAAQQAEHIATLEAAQAQRNTQIFALQTLAQGCEQSRVQDAADAEARQAILGGMLGSEGAAKPAPEQSPATAPPAFTPQASPQESTHDRTRAAVANRLNRDI